MPEDEFMKLFEEINEDFIDELRDDEREIVQQILSERPL